MKQANNYSLILSKLVVHTLKTNNIDTFYISPGYRDAPMIAALLEAGDSLNLHSAMDERAAAYMALGYAKASSKAVVLLCTSGTAVANYFPAVIEAKEDQIPLIVISCDRPNSLVFNGANQTIDQSNIFSDFVKKSICLDAPSNITDLYSVQQKISLLGDVANSFPSGPVHLNLPLVGPLEPKTQESEGVEKLARDLEVIMSTPTLPAGSISVMGWDFNEEIKAKIVSASRPMIIVGRMNRMQRQELKDLVGHLKLPSFFDLGSGMKFQDGFEIIDLEHPQMRDILKSYKPDLVMHFGKRAISKYFDIFMKQEPEIDYFVFSDYENQQVAECRLHTRVRCCGASALKKVIGLIRDKSYPTLKGIRELKYRNYQSVRAAGFCGPTIAQSTISSAGEWNFYVAISMVRLFDTWVFTTAQNICDFEMNRGERNRRAACYFDRL